MTLKDLCAAANKVPAGDYAGASQVLVDIALVLKGKLLPHQRSYLYRLRQIWQARMLGADIRWNAYGSKPGPPRRKKVDPRVQEQADRSHTHWIAWDVAPMGNQARADCGALVLRTQYSETPSCPDCQKLLTGDTETAVELGITVPVETPKAPTPADALSALLDKYGS